MNSSTLHKLQLIGLVLFFSTSIYAQRVKVTEPDLIKLMDSKRIKTVNRNAALISDTVYSNGIHMDAKEGDGVAWLQNIKFSNGTIEFDVKGKDVMQQSFVGIAFHGINDSTFDAIYFRPFNFQSPDTARRRHSVQYIALPLYDWQKLRQEHPNKYEDSIHAAPQPNDWFHVSVVIQSPTVSVYVNRNKKASLVVEKLNDFKKGMIGFWVGNGSDGDFANLKLTQMEE